MPLLPTKSKTMAYKVFDISDTDQDLIEQLGTKSKFWFDEEKKLYKEGRPNTGENWAEVVSSRICDILLIPHAHYDFAIYKTSEGVICESVVPEGGRLVHANELLVRFDNTYDVEKKHKQTAYTLNTVLALLRTISKRLQLPPGWTDTPDEVKDPLGLFIGYIMLDALIANQDRHHENWGVIAQPHGAYLAPTFDHASSLGREVTDDARKDRLNTKDQRRTLKCYAEKGLSAFYDMEQLPKRLGTVEAFKRAARQDSKAAKAWLNRLNMITDRNINDIFHSIPKDKIRISDLAIEFAVRLLLENKKRLISIGEVL